MRDKYLKAPLKSQTGYASFIIVLITIIVVGLIVVAFAVDSRLEQKNSLANVLATQAYYAAESGINDAYAVIANEVATNNHIVSSTSGTCTPVAYVKSSAQTINGKQVASNNLSSNVKYSCITVNATPTSLSYNDIQPGAGQVVEVSNANNVKIGSITLSWQYYQSTVNGQSLTFSDCPSSSVPIGVGNSINSKASLPQSDPTSGPSLSPNLCGAGFLQVDLISRHSLKNSISIGTLPIQSTLFFEPKNNQYGNPAKVAQATLVSPNATSTNNSYINNYYVLCSSNHPNTVYACTATINLPSSDSSTYYLHIQTFYQPINLNISATAIGAGKNPIPLANAQVVIDSTGYAGGQYKRLVERVCAGSYCNSTSPDGAIQSTECINKRFAAYYGAPTPTTGC